jgi:Na+-translocating ferredoxin:NAD+ oxidoreductase RnfA subunit
MSAKGSPAGAATGLNLLPLCAAVVLAVLGYLPTRNRAGDDGMRAMLAALAVAVGTAYVTLFPAIRRMTVAKDVPARFQAALRAGVERFIITLALAGAVTWRTDIPPRVFLLWVAISYLVMITVETAILIRWAKKLETKS